MALLDRLKGILSGQRMCSSEHLASYKRLGEQVFEVEVELADATNTRALVLLRAAKSLQVMGDELLRDAFQSDDKPSQPVPVVTHELAEAWYQRIPDLLVAARQEASFQDSSNVSLPIRLGNRAESQGACPIQHLAGLRRATDEMDNLVKDKMAYVRTMGDVYKPVILLYEEARTRRQSGDAIVGSIASFQRVSPQSHEEGEEQYWLALSFYLLIAQTLEDPTLSAQGFHSAKQKECRLDSRDLFKITSKIAIQEIRQFGEYAQAQVDFAEIWTQHIITETEREYENTIDDLLTAGMIQEDGYWYCCPFQPVYRVLSDAVQVMGHTISKEHVFVWDYGKDGESGRFITQSKFGHSDSRHYCED